MTSTSTLCSPIFASTEIDLARPRLEFVVTRPENTVRLSTVRRTESSRNCDCRSTRNTTGEGWSVTPLSLQPPKIRSGKPTQINLDTDLSSFSLTDLEFSTIATPPD